MGVDVSDDWHIDRTLYDRCCDERPTVRSHETGSEIVCLSCGRTVQEDTPSKSLEVWNQELRSVKK